MALGGWDGPDRIVQRLRSMPIKIHWRGFYSDTYEMGKAGWQISAHEDVRCMQMQLAFARDGDPGSSGEPNKLRGITQKFSWDYAQALDPSRPFNGRMELVAEVLAIGSRVHIQGMGTPTFSRIDPTPQLWTGKITSLDDMAHFLPAGNVGGQDIIVPEDSVEELLAKILEKQQPAKVARATTEYYDQKDSGLLVPRVHAKIISLTDFKAAS